jgi:hypothetical protein
MRVVKARVSRRLLNMLKAMVAWVLALPILLQSSLYYLAMYHLN